MDRDGGADGRSGRIRLAPRAEDAGPLEGRKRAGDLSYQKCAKGSCAVQYAEPGTRSPLGDPVRVMEVQTHPV